MHKLAGHCTLVRKWSTHKFLLSLTANVLLNIFLALFLLFLWSGLLVYQCKLPVVLFVDASFFCCQITNYTLPAILFLHYRIFTIYIRNSDLSVLGMSVLKEYSQLVTSPANLQKWQITTDVIQYTCGSTKRKSNTNHNVATKQSVNDELTTWQVLVLKQCSKPNSTIVSKSNQSLTDAIPSCDSIWCVTVSLDSSCLLWQSLHMFEHVCDSMSLF